MTRGVRELSVGVIGCGTAGSAAAVFLARQGHHVVVYERVAEPRPVGAGIVLQPTGLAVLERLGIKREILARGARIDRLTCVTDRKRTLFDLEYRELDDKYYGVGLHRGVLFQSLFNEVGDSGAELRLGVNVVDLARAPHRTLAGRALARRHYVVDDAGVRHGPHDLVVVADGARSSLRDDTDRTQSVEAYPWGALWFVGEDKERRFRRVLSQYVRSNRTMLGFLPTGTGPAGITPLVSLYWSVRVDAVERLLGEGLSKWREEVLDLCPDAEDLMFQVRGPESLVFSAYHDVVMNRWSTRDVVYLGDAAHATSPQLGQGANLALVDAMVLADTLEKHDDLALALEAYSRKRASHLGFYQVATRLLTPFFQGDEPAYGAVRDLVMPVMNRIGPARRLMTLSMCGLSEGFSGRTLRL
jgi:2-polyprenyl-6-methoxyphenol hydroxylase-like FAD-dependent oxidoreductase